MTTALLACSALSSGTEPKKSMAKLPYESPTTETEPFVDTILASNDNAFFDPWGMINLP